MTGGFWAERMRTNRERTLPHAFEQLVEAGNLENFRLAAGTASGRYRALGIMFDGPFPFLDSDVYKWLEGVGWELGRAWDDGIARDGRPGDRRSSPRRSATTATSTRSSRSWRRGASTGTSSSATSCTASATSSRRPSPGTGRSATTGCWPWPGAPRTPSTRPWGRTARRASTATRRSRWRSWSCTGSRARRATSSSRACTSTVAATAGWVADGSAAAYWQDIARSARRAAVAGHAVRQLYLDAGAMDVAVETGDARAARRGPRRWRDMVATRTYLTGGVGSRHAKEAFGDPYELPPDRAYTETCAAIAA